MEGVHGEKLVLSLCNIPAKALVHLFAGTSHCSDSIMTRRSFGER